MKVTKRHLLLTPWDIWGPVACGVGGTLTDVAPRASPSSSAGWHPRLIWAGGGRLVHSWVAELGPGERTARLSGKVTIYSLKKREKKKKKKKKK